MLRGRRIGSTVLITLTALAATAACGADPGTAAGDSGAGGFLGPQLTVALDLTGATSLKGEQHGAAPSNNGAVLADCAEYAKGSTKDGKTLYVMAGLLDGPVSGRKVTLELWIDDYAGPGTYPKDQLVAPGSRPSIAVDDVVYGTWPDSTGSEVTTDGEGGGTWTFTALAATAEGGLPGKPLNGSVTWTCRD